MVACMQAAADKDAAAFCVATFLAHAPHQTVREAAAMGKRVRDFGSAGFPNVHGGSGVTSGWVGFQDGVQSHNTHIWKQ